ncbi:hypothetical protein Y900_030870 [Mycolicibacterium aromaticivorans JS19b1 = JCM 16368]|uniref:Uncharacterized protein n=1 Tax=Mycolicibacterium aromaticivorans JS19b1 = JCM 16368 TaxID=1440774 RepID=A0A064CDB2_9MYCO|nr:hypothetical protein Y900_030870 [Mycolicibacterium aromaticivorans JS19b1 = JCM 16368]
MDAYAATRLRAYAQAKPKKMSESELVKYALDLVIDEADRQLAALQQKVLADANRTAQALGGTAEPTPLDTAARLGPQVPAGSETFQAKIKEAKALRLNAIRRAYDASDSQLIRRGFELILDEMHDTQAQLLQQLHADYLATQAAIRGTATVVTTTDHDTADHDTTGDDRVDHDTADDPGLPWVSSSPETPNVQRAHSDGDAAKEAAGSVAVASPEGPPP